MRSNLKLISVDSKAADKGSNKDSHIFFVGNKNAVSSSDSGGVPQLCVTAHNLCSYIILSARVPVHLITYIYIVYIHHIIRERQVSFYGSWRERNLQNQLLHLNTHMDAVHKEPTL